MQWIRARWASTTLVAAPALVAGLIVSAAWAQTGGGTGGTGGKAGQSSTAQTPGQQPSSPSAPGAADQRQSGASTSRQDAGGTTQSPGTSPPARETQNQQNQTRQSQTQPNQEQQNQTQQNQTRPGVLPTPPRFGSDPNRANRNQADPNRTADPSAQQSHDWHAVTKRIARAEPQSAIEMQVFRDGQTMDAEATLGGYWEVFSEDKDWSEVAAEQGFAQQGMRMDGYGRSGDWTGRANASGGQYDGTRMQQGVTPALEQRVRQLEQEVGDLREQLNRGGSTNAPRERQDRRDHGSNNDNGRRTSAPAERQDNGQRTDAPPDGQ
jgi:hypothetical protein